MKKYLVIGGTGLVGSRFVELVSKERRETPTSQEIDILDKDSLKSYFSEKKDKFDVVINFAAYTNVAEAETQREDERGSCWQLNALGAENLSNICKEFGKFLIHISTDFVFEGLDDNPGPYSEDAATPKSPDNLSWYGWTKLVGEKKVMEKNDNAAIVRISYPYRNSYEKKTDFARKIISLYDEGKLYPMFNDQMMTPVFIDHLIAPLEKLAELSKPGFYHMVDSGLVSPFEFAAHLLKKTRNAEDVVKRSSLKEFLKDPKQNKRPVNGGLKTEKTQKILGLKFNTWKEAIDEFAKNI